MKGAVLVAETIIALQSVTKSFVAGEVQTYALHHVDLEIHSGEFVSIEGPSGSGKTTLLGILGLLLRPTEGSFHLAGEPVERLSATELATIRNHEIGFIFQAFNLIGDLTVHENVELPLTYRRLTRAERDRRVHEALERVGMSHRAQHYPSQLSGGQQQRVAVARALIGEPSLLLADEPTGNLDTANGEAVMTLLRELHEDGAAICMVTHDPRYASFAERTIQIRDGQIVN
jgi:putative ABC transport system ATP-binding protein